MSGRYQHRPFPRGGTLLSGDHVKSVKTLLRQTAVELVAGKELLAQKKRATHGKGRMSRKNAKRAVKTIERTLDSIAEHHELLLEQEQHVDQPARRGKLAAQR
jgi:hypothetical protein